MASLSQSLPVKTDCWRRLCFRYLQYYCIDLCLQRSGVFNRMLEKLCFWIFSLRQVKDEDFTAELLHAADKYELGTLVISITSIFQSNKPAIFRPLSSLLTQPHILHLPSSCSGLQSGSPTYLLFKVTSRPNCSWSRFMSFVEPD